MEVGRSISKAISECLHGDLDSAMIHACNAVDGTAKKTYPVLGVGARFRKLLRENYASLLKPMMPGINFEKTLFPVNISGASGPGGLPDLADILYVIHRCHHGHGEPLPVGWELIPDTTTKPPCTTMNLTAPNGELVVRLSDRIIFGMAAVALLSPVNVGQILEGVHLTYTSVASDITVRLDNGWWGRADDLATIAAMDHKDGPVTAASAQIGLRSRHHPVCGAALRVAPHATATRTEEHVQRVRSLFALGSPACTLRHKTTERSS